MTTQHMRLFTHIYMTEYWIDLYFYTIITESKLSV